MSWGLWAISPEGAAALREQVRLLRGMGKLELRGLFGDDSGDERKPLEIRDAVAVIPVQGPLSRRAGWLAQLLGLSSYETIAALLNKAAADTQVRAILLKIDSPGGEASGCDGIAAQIRSCGKPVVAYAEGTCASAAYWLASGGREVWASAGSFVGSIGVRAMLLDDTGAQKQCGERKIEIVSTGSPGKRSQPIDDEVIARVQRQLDDLAGVFVAAVAQGRRTTPSKVLADFGQGDVLIGSRALAARMVDKIGSFEGALARAREIGGGAPAPAAPARRTSVTSNTSMTGAERAEYEALIQAARQDGRLVSESHVQAVRSTFTDGPDGLRRYLAGLSPGGPAGAAAVSEQQARREAIAARMDGIGTDRAPAAETLTPGRLAMLRQQGYHVPLEHQARRQEIAARMDHIGTGTSFPTAGGGGQRDEIARRMDAIGTEPGPMARQLLAAQGYTLEGPQTPEQAQQARRARLLAAAGYKAA